MIGRQAAAKGQGCFHHSFLLCALFTTLHEQSTLPEATLTLLLRNDLESLSFADPQLTRFISKCFIKRKAWKDSARRNKPPHPPRTYPAPPFYLFPQFVIILLNIWTAGDRCKRYPLSRAVNSYKMFWFWNKASKLLYWFARLFYTYPVPLFVI